MIRDYLYEDLKAEEARENAKECDPVSSDSGADDQGENEPSGEQEEGEANATLPPPPAYVPYQHESWEADSMSDLSGSAETVDMSSWIPQNFYIDFDDEGNYELTLWQHDPTLEQVVLPTGAFDAWTEQYPCTYMYLANVEKSTKLKYKAGKEVPRSEALQDQEFWRAMEKELEQLRTNGAQFCKPPPEGDNTFVYTSRWVYTYKEDGMRKARLVVRGFEEQWNPDSQEHATDSPTLHRDSIRIICMTAANKRWDLESWDIRTAFQQAMTSDDPDQTMTEELGLMIKLPKWLPGKFNANGMCLKIPSGKTLYGMASAPRRWFFTLRKVMLECGFVTSKSDDCMFMYEDEEGNLHGLAGWHVDDGLLTGDDVFWKAMEKVAERLQFGKRAKGEFKFCGMRIIQKEDKSVSLDQSSMIMELEEIPLDARRNANEDATPQEKTMMRGRIGSMLYLTGMTRPFESYAVSHLAGFTNEAKVGHLKEINKLVQHFLANPDIGLIYEAGCSVDCMYTFHDSSFKSERESGSQMGILSFVGPKILSNGTIRGVSLLRWASKRARRVCHSTLAAETLAATAGLDSQAGLKFRLKELGYNPASILLTDCRSLFEHIYAMTGKTAEILLPDIHELREATMPWRSSLSEDYSEDFVELWWCSTKVQLADNLTKKITPSSHDFVEVLKTCTIKLGNQGKEKDSGWLRPRPTQRAHSFGTFLYNSLDILREISENPAAQCSCGQLCPAGEHTFFETPCPTQRDTLHELRSAYTSWLSEVLGPEAK